MFLKISCDNPQGQLWNWCVSAPRPETKNEKVIDLKAATKKKLST
jgi:hypothetical protein